MNFKLSLFGSKEKKIAQEAAEVYKKTLEDRISELELLDRSIWASVPKMLGKNKFEVRKELPLDAAISEAYLINPTVSSCINAIADSCSVVPFVLRKKDTDGQYKTIFRDPCLDLLENPNNINTQAEFKKTIVMDLQLAGNCIIWMNTDKTVGISKVKEKKVKKPVTELIRLNPDYITPIDNGFEIIQYIGKERTPLEGNKWEADEIMHFKLINPGNPFWGISPIQSAFKAVDVDSKILEWWLTSLDNSCRRDALIKFKHDLSDKQFKRVRQLFDSQVTGYLNGRGPLILGHECEVEFLDMAPAEFDFAKSRELSKQEIGSAFRVPPPCRGDFANASLNNYKEANLSFWLDTILPLMHQICEVLTKKLLPKYDYDVAEYWISYDASDIPALESKYAEKWETIGKMVANGVPLNMAAKQRRAEMPNIPGGDIGTRSHNQVPLDYYENLGKYENADPTSTTTVEGTML